MAVMTQMRDRAAVILFVLLVLFVLSMTVGGLVGGANIMDIITGKHPNAIGVINGVEISLQDFDENFTSQMQQYRSQTGAELQDNQIEFIRNQVWNSMVQQVLLAQTFKEKDITAADAEILYRLFEAPPDFLKSLPAFQNEQQQFDEAKYKQAIHDLNTADQWRPIERYMRDFLPREKLEQRLRASVRVTEDEVRREYLNRNQNVKVEYIFINPRDFSAENIDITDEMIERYYKEHKEDYRQPEQRAIEYVIFSTAPTAADTVEIYERANRVLEKARAGDDFADLAEMYSDDAATNQKGGSLDYFARGDLVMFKSFEDDLFGAEQGDIVGPVKSALGLHLIKIEDKRKGDKEELKASHILFKFEPSRKTVNKARDDAQYLAAEAQTTPFADLANEVADTVLTTGLFVKGLFVPGIGRNQKVANFTFANEVGDVSPVVEIDKGYLVYRISEMKPENIKPLEEVKTVIKNKLLSDRRMEKAGERAQHVYQEIQTGISFREAAARDSLQVKEPTPFNRAGSVPGVGRDIKFIGAAFALDETGDISAPVEGTRGVYVLKLIEKDKFDEQDFASQKARLAAQMKQRRESLIFNSWYSEIRDKADIKDYRGRYYN